MNRNTFLIWNSAGITNTGNVRSINQDAYLNLPEIGLWVVADGMGGHEAGEVASRTIIEHLQHLRKPQDLNGYIEEVQRCILGINQKLREIAAQKYNNAVVGSTIVVLIAYANQYACLWAGDSRLYRLRNRKLIQISKDHNMVETYIAKCAMNPKLPYNSKRAEALTRAVGGDDQLEIDLKIDQICKDDIFLLCSDGLYQEVSSEKISQLLDQGDDCTTMTKNLLKNALAGDAKDNITVSVVQISEVYD